MSVLRIIPSLILACVLAIAVPANAAPVKNISNDSISEYTGNLSLNQIANVIKVAGLKRGWIIKRTGTNTMQGRLDVRTHTAIIDIKFSRKAFSIEYNSSRNLNYKNGNIHNNYNRWVKNLEQDIILGLYERTLR